MSSTPSPRTKLIQQARLLLGDQMVEVELDPEHYNLAVDLAIERFRQRSDASMEEQIMFLTLEPDKGEYTLPNNVQIVRKIHRRGIGTTTGSGGINFDPLQGMFSNYFLLQWGQTGGIATWELFSEYKETLSRIFGSEIDFIWSRPDHKLTIIRRPQGIEVVMLTVYVEKSEDAIISDTYSKPWIRDFTLAQCKLMLGEARDKFPGGFAGPNGTVQLNGASLKTEANADLARLEQEILLYATADMGMPFIIG